MDDVVIAGPYRSLDQLKDGRKVEIPDDEKEKLAEARKKRDQKPDEPRIAEGQTQSEEPGKNEQLSAASGS